MPCFVPHCKPVTGGDSRTTNWRALRDRTVGRNRVPLAVLKSQVFILLPLCVAVGYLCLPIFDRYPVHPIVSAVFLLILAILVIAFLISGIVAKRHSKTLQRISILTFCSLAPLAILNAWTLAPRGPYGFGGYGYFLHWLTRYPNFGSINLEVFLGIVCVIISSFLPALLATYSLTKRPSKVLVGFMCFIELLALVAVIVHLDLPMLIVGTKIFSSTFLAGPLLRLAGGSAMVVAAYGVMTRKTEQNGAA